MGDLKNFDELMRDLLSNEANLVEPEEEKFRKLNERINIDNHVERLSLKERLFKNAFPLQLNIKRYLVATMLFLIIIPGLTLTFSKEARVAAYEGINAIGKWIYVVNKTDKGYDTVKVNVPETDPFKEWTFDYTGMNDEELAKEFGSYVYVPSELWGGYKCFQKRKGVRKSDNSTSEIVGLYGNKEHELILNIYNENYLENYKYKKVFNVRNNKLYWVEDGPYGIYPNHDLQQKPVGVKIEHFLMWEYKGAVYRVYNPDGNLTYDIAQRIAEQFINKTYPPYDSMKKVGLIRSLTYLPKSTTIGEIQGMVGFKVKIPDTLPDKYKITVKTVGMDPNEKECNMFEGEYENGSKTMKFTITESDWPVMEIDRIKEPKDDTRTIVIGHKECKWTFIDGSHMLGWKDDGVYYCLYFDHGDFSSQEEAASIAKVIIGK
ncbi:MAG: hypothetical protein Q8942_20070 [Bacillota bacterium]|nr:hypothetical protein [Bacillota bacterium]